MFGSIKFFALTISLLIFIPMKSYAGLMYWSLFNIEGESSLGAQYVTYASLNDMLNDQNRQGAFNPDGVNVARNIIGSGSDGTNFWSLFNVEGESNFGAQYVTYASMDDMLSDENRLGAFNPDGVNVARNIIGSGSDGAFYWSLFNLEGESSLGAQYVTYASMNDMLNDQNRLGVFSPDGLNVARNIIGSGSDGSNFWSLFNVEGESNLGAQYVTYGSMNDMLNDQNRLGVFNPDGVSVASNIIGSGAFSIDEINVVSEPDLLWSFLFGIAAIKFFRRRKITRFNS